MKFKNFIFQAFKVMEFNCLSWKGMEIFGRLVIAGVKARTMQVRDKWLDSGNGMHFSQHQSLSELGQKIP